jgi:hypothetical protein
VRPATIDAVSWEAAVVAIVVAAIGIGGVSVGARLQSRSSLAQWRRDRLLQFCADLVAAGRELVGRRWETDDPRRYPTETIQRLDHAVACVLLLGGQDLDKPAFAYQGAVLDALNAAIGPDSDSQKKEQTLKTAVEAQANFLWLAHNLLLDSAEKPRRWWQFWSRTSAEQLATEATAQS